MQKKRLETGAFFMEIKWSIYRSFVLISDIFKLSQQQGWSSI
jgi:hypothetical protein